MNFFVLEYNNSPGLVPLACQILDTFLFPLVLLPSSSLLLFFISFFLLPSSLFPLRPDLYVLGRDRAHIGGRQGGLARQTPRLAGRRTPSQLRLKIALFCDAVFLRCWLHHGPKMASKIHQNL